MLQMRGLALGADTRDEEIRELESKTVALLEQEMPDRVPEYKSNVGNPPAGVDARVHRVRTRLERLVRYKDQL